MLTFYLSKFHENPCCLKNNNDVSFPLITKVTLEYLENVRELFTVNCFEIIADIATIRFVFVSHKGQTNISRKRLQLWYWSIGNFLKTILKLTSFVWIVFEIIAKMVSVLIFCQRSIRYISKTSVVWKNYCTVNCY